MRLIIIILWAASVIVLFFVMCKKIANINASQRRASEKNNLLMQWIYIKNHNRTISDYLIKKGLYKVVFWGDSFINDLVKQELIGATNIEYKFVDSNYLIQDAMNQEKISGNEDALIITDAGKYRELSCEYYKRINMPIFLFTDILYEINKGI